VEISPVDLASAAAVSQLLDLSTPSRPQHNGGSVSLSQVLNKPCLEIRVRQKVHLQTIPASVQQVRNSLIKICAEEGGIQNATLQLVWTTQLLLGAVDRQMLMKHLS
jgi:hypothetical protein